MEKGDPKVFGNHENSLNGIRDFYEKTREAYEQYNPLSDASQVSPGQPIRGVIVSGAQSSTVATSYIAGISIQDRHIMSGIKSHMLAKLHKIMPSLMCSFWELFIKDCEAHFGTKIEEYHNNQMKEIFLIRNCILHNGGIADDSYCTQTALKKFAKNEEMNLRETDITEFLGYLEGAYTDVRSMISSNDI